MSRILIVDDNRDTCEALAEFLDRSGHIVECAHDGKAALVAIISSKPDLMVLDLFMPEMDGVGLLQVIRSYLRLQTLPVVIWTAYEDKKMIERARELNARSILFKHKSTLDDVLANITTILSE